MPRYQSRIIPNVAQIFFQPDAAPRFLRLYRSGTGDYTRDRHQWLKGATIQEIMAEVGRRGNPAA